AYTGQPGRESLFFIDCISRVLFLGPDFPKEMVAVNTGQPLIGALTLGEIANNGSDFLEFFNKTAVVGLIDA
ncbi:MAG TPA: FIST C-terminal domain-containing protein, partial [Rhodoferax sp.]